MPPIDLKEIEFTTWIFSLEVNDDTKMLAEMFKEFYEKEYNNVTLREVVRKRKYTKAEMDENQRDYRFKVKTET